MTVSRLRSELTDAEFVYYAAYFEVKGEREKREMERAKIKRR
jgi:predicted transcriptional regulator YdeE